MMAKLTEAYLKDMSTASNKKTDVNLRVAEDKGKDIIRKKEKQAGLIQIELT